MKGLVGFIFLGICVILAAAIVAGALTFPEAMDYVWMILTWIFYMIVGVFAAIGIIVTALAVGG